MDISFPLEFIVPGTPVSSGASARSRREWKERVRAASAIALPESHFATDGALAITLLYFPGAEAHGDVDNIIKPVLDSLSRHIYIDDKQIERVWIQRFAFNKTFEFASPSRKLLEAIEGERPLLYVRLSDDPTEGLRHVFER